jgi:hypothetical protein
MFNETMGFNSQNRGYKTAVWQNSWSVNVQWCGKCVYLILVSGRLNNNAATNENNSNIISSILVRIFAQTLLLAHLTFIELFPKVH